MEGEDYLKVRLAETDISVKRFFVKILEEKAKQTEAIHTRLGGEEYMSQNSFSASESHYDFT